MVDPERGEAPRRTRIGRRGLLAAGASTAALGAIGWQVAPPQHVERVRTGLGIGPEPFVPDAPEGDVRVERVSSQAMGEVDLFTAVPAGHGDGAGLPVVVVLHGSSASAAALRDFGLGRFVTAAVRAGAAPFVLAGTDDGPAGWVPGGSVDPPRMLRDELPGWLAERGFDAERRALDALANAAPVAPDPWSSGDGGHTRTYWNDHTLEMLGWLVGTLPPA